VDVWLVADSSAGYDRPRHWDPLASVGICWVNGSKYQCNIYIYMIIMIIAIFYNIYIVIFNNIIIIIINHNK